MDSALDTLLGGPRRQDPSEHELAEEIKAACADIPGLFAAPSAASSDAIDGIAAALHFASRKTASPELVTGLLDVSKFCYVTGQSKAGLLSVTDAVRVARMLPEGELSRKALYFQGNLLVDTGNLPYAIECFAEALDLSITAGDRLTEAKVWNNVGAALISAVQYSDAVACLERAIALAQCEATLADLVDAAYSNIALACAQLEDCGKGLRAAVRSTENAKIPASASAMLSRVLAESYYIRLLLQVGAVEKAKERYEIAKRIAAQSGLARAQLIASMIEGLYEVQVLKQDGGLVRLQGVLQQTRELAKGGLRDVLLAVYKAHELAGKHDLAFTYLRELMLLTRSVQEESVLFHHRLHLKQIETIPRQGLGDPIVFLERQEQALRDKLARQIAEQELMRSRIEMLERLAVTAELRDDATGEHAYRVGRLASLLSRDVGCDEQICFMIDLAARLHDIGKIGVPDDILLARRRLSEPERELIQTHAMAGAELLGQSEVAHLQMAEDIAKFHHECWDGSGYPSGLSATAIPLPARITALADVFDTLTHSRPYRDAWPVDRALHEIARLKGVRFDPHLTDLFLALVPRLQMEVDDLDEYLAAAARQSPFLRARERITGTLRKYEAERQRAHRDSVLKAVK